jgi:hypothetical protein
MRSPDTGVISRFSFSASARYSPVAQRLVECLAQRSDALDGRAGRRREGPCHELSRQSDLEDLSLFVGLA